MAIKISGMVSGLDTDAMVQELVSAYSKKTETYEKEKTKLEWKQEAWKELNTQIYDLYSKTISSMRYSSAYNKKSTTVSDETKATVTAGSKAVKGTQSLVVKSLAASGYMTGAELRDKDAKDKLSATSTLGSMGVSDPTKITLTLGNGDIKTIKVDSTTTISALVKEFEGAGVNANFDEENQRFFISSKDVGEDLDFELSGDTELLKTLGLTEESGAIKLEGTDAEIVLNGATYKSNDNTFNINGLTITAKDVTGKDASGKDIAVKLVTDTDVDGIYNTIKDFIKGYNELINKMDKIYNADSAKGYEPLTDEEKEAMSEEEVEKWETKIKDSLFRRDSTVSSLSNALKMVMRKTFDVDGKTYSLSSFGIATGSYFTMKENEKNAFHIDGDKDDETSASNDDKLRAMISSDPEAVESFFTQLSTALYNDLTDRMKSTSLSSAFTVYNDKQMKEEMNDLDKKIDKWEDYVTTQEDYWYNKFTEMEKAMGELQSQTSALSGLLGM